MMKASQERNLHRWLHIILSIPIVGYIYGPVSRIPQAVIFVRWVFVPLVVITGLWMWKGHLVKRIFKRRRQLSRINESHPEKVVGERLADKT